MFMCLDYAKRLKELKNNYNLIKDQESDLGKLFEYYYKVDLNLRVLYNILIMICSTIFI